MSLRAPEHLKNQLPNVGDILVKTPVSGKYLGICSGKPQKGTVVYVNREHLWYLVQFASGYREVFYIPDIGEALTDAYFGQRRVKCVETDTIYDTASEAARAMKCAVSNISEACRGIRLTTRGFHWHYVED